MTQAAVRVDPDMCTGCRACELACALHHTGRMRPASASVKIGRSNLTGAITWTVDVSCDLCVGEQELECAKYCPVDAIQMESAV